MVGLAGTLPAPVRWPPSVALVGAKGGVGRSSLALNLALAAGSRRVLLVDANVPGGSLSLLAGSVSPPPLLGSDLPTAVPLAPGVDLAQLCDEAAAAGRVAVWPADQDLGAFEAGYDWIVVDTGCGTDAMATAAALAADEVLVVLAPEMTAVADGYAQLKLLKHRRPGLVAGCIANMVDSGAEGDRVQRGFADLVRSFLGAEIDIRGYIPLDRGVRVAAKGQTAFVRALPLSPAAAAVARLATFLTERQPPVRQPTERAFLQGVVRAFVACLAPDRDPRQVEASP